MYSKLCLLMVALTVLVSISGCGSAQDAPEQSEHVGTATVEQQTLTLFGPIGVNAGFEGVEPFLGLDILPYEIRVVEGSSVDAGIQGTLGGIFDIMILTRQPLPGEALEFYEVAHTPIAIFVNSEAGIDNLSHAQVAGIFAGDITNWAEIGGADLELKVLILPETDPITQNMRVHFFGDTPFPAQAINLAIESDVVGVAEGLPGAVGYAQWAGVQFLETRSATDYLNAVSIDGMALDNPNYPYINSIGFAYLSEQQAFLQPLLDLIGRITASDATRLLVRQFGITLVDTSSTASDPQ